jgi:hypothetical protein
MMVNLVDEDEIRSREGVMSIHQHTEWQLSKTPKSRVSKYQLTTRSYEYKSLRFAHA